MPIMYLCFLVIETSVVNINFPSRLISKWIFMESSPSLVPFLVYAMSKIAPNIEFPIV
jgi:hypothetical protein